MSEEQRECYHLLCDLMGGKHHIDGSIREWGYGIYWNQLSSVSTFDYDLLTRAVILAHDRCIRLEIRPAGPRNIAFAFTKRRRDGRMSERHPTIEDAVAAVRRAWPQPSGLTSVPADSPSSAAASDTAQPASG